MAGMRETNRIRTRKGVLWVYIVLTVSVKQWDDWKGWMVRVTREG